MRLFHVFLILSFLFGVNASSLDSRQLYVHPLDAGDVTDVCGNVGKLVVPNAQGGNTVVGTISQFNAPLSQPISRLPQFLQTNPVAIQGIAIAGAQAVLDFLTNLIVGNAPTDCNYPVHSEPMCINRNPCGFTCTDGYTAFPASNPTTCICAAPNVVCNGQCVASGACPSVQATLKKRWVGSGSCTMKGPGWAACGVYGGGARAWECVHTERDLESCGGCVLPLTPLSPIGKDCSALPGVADVSCLSGECVVRRCMSGYSLSRDNTRCIPTRAHIPYVTGPDDELMQAIRYGLEHLPL